MQKVIKIDCEVYDRLRAHCDSNAVRFQGFVEDALENAIGIDEIEAVRRDAERLSEWVRREHGKILLQGFRKGFVAAVHLLHGRIGASDACTPAEVAEVNQAFVCGDGKQIALFD